jgi:hypothetical protein
LARAEGPAFGMELGVVFGPSHMPGDAFFYNKRKKKKTRCGKMCIKGEGDIAKMVLNLGQTHGQ